MGDLTEVFDLEADVVVAAIVALAVIVAVKVVVCAEVIATVIVVDVGASVVSHPRVSGGLRRKGCASYPYCDRENAASCSRHARNAQILERSTGEGQKQTYWFLACLLFTSEGAL